MSIPLFNLILAFILAVFGGMLLTQAIYAIDVIPHSRGEIARRFIDAAITLIISASLIFL